jgi:hypothetical protein
VSAARAEVARILKSQRDTTTRDLYFCALLSREVGEQDAPTIVVGGSAIEIYTEGAYVSGDIDLVGNRTALAKILKSWGFTRKGREWYSQDWRIAVDLVGGPGGLTGSRARVRIIVTPYGPVRLAAVEDLIIKRLVSAKYWEIRSDREHAAILARKYRDELDRGYLSEAAIRAEVPDEWTELERRLYSSPPEGPPRKKRP